MVLLVWVDVCQSLSVSPSLTNVACLINIRIQGMVTIWTLVFRCLCWCPRPLLKPISIFAFCHSKGQQIELLDFICFISDFPYSKLLKSRTNTNTIVSPFAMWFVSFALLASNMLLSVEGFALDFFGCFLNLHFGSAFENRLVQQPHVLISCGTQTAFISLGRFSWVCVVLGNRSKSASLVS